MKKLSILMILVCLLIGAFVVKLAFGPFCVSKLKTLSSAEMVSAALNAPFPNEGRQDEEFFAFSKKNQRAQPVRLTKYAGYRRGLFGETRVSVTRVVRWAGEEVAEMQATAKVSRCGRVTYFPEVMGGDVYATQEEWLQTIEGKEE